MGSNPKYSTKMFFDILVFFGTVAQLVEHQTENLGVTGSNPVGTTTLNKKLQQ